MDDLAIATADMLAKSRLLFQYDDATAVVTGSQLARYGQTNYTGANYRYVKFVQAGAPLPDSIVLL